MAILLKVDEKGIAAAVQRIKLDADKVNAFVDKASHVLGRTFIDEEKRELFERGFDFVMAELRERFPHPGADDEINLRLMGVDVSEIRQLGYARSTWSKYPQELDADGQFQVVDIMELPEIKAKYTYTQNKEQERFYKFAEKVSKMLNELRDEQFIHAFTGKPTGVLETHAEHRLSEIISLVSFEYIDGERKFRPNIQRIKVIEPMPA